MRLGADDGAGRERTGFNVAENSAKLRFQVVALKAALSVVKIGNFHEGQAEFIGTPTVMVHVHLPFDGRVPALAFARVAAIDNVNGLPHPALLSREDTGLCKAIPIG